MKAFYDKKSNGFLNWDYLKSEKKENRELSKVPHSVFCKLTRTPNIPKRLDTLLILSRFSSIREGNGYLCYLQDIKMDEITHDH